MEIELTDLDEEEPNDKEAIELVLRKHRKLFRHLFEKYSNTCYTHKAKVFDTLRAKSEQISLAEFRKMLNDHKIEHLGREELAAFFRLINFKQDRTDIQNLPFDGFIECFMQVAIHLHNNTSKAISCIPLVDSVKSLLARFAATASSRGESTVLYTDPEAAALLGEDQELLRQLNAMIEKSPNYPLPEGFKKVQEKEIRYVHQLCAFSSAPGLRIAVEILDEVLNSALGLHFVEPRTKCEFVTKVRPEALKISASSTQMIYPSSSRYLEVASNKSRSNRLGQLEDTKRSKPEILPKPAKVSAGTKLMVANLPKELRSIGLEVGAVVEEIVKAVEKGRRDIESKGEKFVNRAVKERNEMMEEMLRIEKAKDGKRKQRQQELKQQLEKKKAAISEVASSEAAPPVAAASPLKKKKTVQTEKELEELKQRFEERAGKRREEKLKAEEEKMAKAKEEKDRRKKELEPFIKKKKEEFVPHAYYIHHPL